jgi:hypothetical protein
MKELIYNQRKIPKSRWRYGIRSSAAAGCGWIAAYNALVLMGYEAFPERLIRYFTYQVPLINGTFGTVAWGPALFFKKRGFKVTLSIRRKKYDAVVKNSDVSILYYHWRSKWKFGGHFATVRYQDGRYIGYNTYSNSTGPDEYGESLEKFLKKRKYFWTMIIGIENKSA